MKKITVVIADDHKLIRETWTYILKSDPEIDILATCGDTDHVVKLAAALGPDIILMDINMGPENGFEATQKILAKNADAKIIGVSMHSQPAYAKKMLQIGARGYVTKNSSSEEMFKAIREVIKGNKYLCAEIKNILSEQLLSTTQDEVPSINLLTEKELQIVKYISAGNSSKEIAALLEITPKTVELHRYNILKKLKLKKTTSLISLVTSSPDFV